MNGTMNLSAEAPSGSELSCPQPTCDEKQRAFRASLNHKLRTPLNAVMGFAELLALQSGNGRRDHDVQRILTAAREMLSVIDTHLTDYDEVAAHEPVVVAPAEDCDVLYIEDDMVNYMLVERILELRPGLKLKHATHGSIGLEQAHMLRPSMILLDLNLPDMHGSEVLQRLREAPTTADIPVVILSANATPSHIERLLAAGARNYVTKPFDIDVFLAVIDEFVDDRVAACA